MYAYYLTLILLKSKLATGLLLLLNFTAHLLLVTHLDTTCKTGHLSVAVGIEPTNNEMLLSILLPYHSVMPLFSDLLHDTL
jgi:hypothetical protein